MNKWEEMDRDVYQRNHEVNRHSRNLYDQFEDGVLDAMGLAGLSIMMRNR